MEAILRRLLSLVLLAVLLQPLPALSQRLVIVSPMVPGLALLREDGTGEGILLEILSQLDPLLKGLELHYEAMNIPRMEQVLAEGRELCVSGIIATAARDRIGYAVPLFSTPPLQVVVREETLASLTLRDGAVTLESLFGNPALRGVLADKRPYPGPLQSRLMAALDAGLLKRQAGGSAGSGQNLLLMVSHGRAGYTFEYPSITVGMTKDRLLKAPLHSLSIHGYEDLQDVVIYCPRTEWGQAMAARLDRAITMLAAHPGRMLPIYARWLPDAVYARYRDRLELALRARAGQPGTLR